jgi:hypothetical protein
MVHTHGSSAGVVVNNVAADDCAISDYVVMVLETAAGFLERQLGHSRCQTLAKASMAASQVAS